MKYYFGMFQIGIVGKPESVPVRWSYLKKMFKESLIY
jgi:hypothetical protein